MRRTEHLAATSSMTKPEVLEVKIQEGLQILSSAANTSCFSSSFSLRRQQVHQPAAHALPEEETSGSRALGGCGGGGAGGAHGTASMMRSQSARSAWSSVVVRRGIASSHAW